MEREWRLRPLCSNPQHRDIAQQVHDCLGRLLAQVVFAGAKMTMPPKAKPIGP